MTSTQSHIAEHHIEFLCSLKCNSPAHTGYLAYVNAKSINITYSSLDLFIPSMSECQRHLITVPDMPKNTMKNCMNMQNWFLPFFLHWFMNSSSYDNRSWILHQISKLSFSLLEHFRFSISSNFVTSEMWKSTLSTWSSQHQNRQTSGKCCYSHDPLGWETELALFLTLREVAAKTRGAFWCASFSWI